MPSWYGTGPLYIGGGGEHQEHGQHGSRCGQHRQAFPAGEAAFDARYDLGLFPVHIRCLPVQIFLPSHLA